VLSKKESVIETPSELFPGEAAKIEF